MHPARKPEARAPGRTPKAVQYGLYPIMLGTLLGTVYLAVRLRWNYQTVYGAATLFLVAVFIAGERLFPLNREWSMTGKSFLRDLKYILLDAPTIALTKSAFGFFAIHYSQRHAGFFTQKPIVISTIVFLLVFEFLQYWFHRFSHGGKGPVGSFLWKVHLAHHLPDRVYVVMHAVFNPINALLSAAIIQTPLILLGIPPAAALAATLLIDLQSLVSHFNADIRAGALNYVFIGTETHRYHHSADAGEAGNFGNTLAVWDLVFGTHRYRPGRNPERLGVGNPGLYPKSENILGVLAFPFLKRAA
jgi:sterol desaturase/sphingolipid hydroxylase (fatty acid hydroxylase superfamily)